MIQVLFIQNAQVHILVNLKYQNQNYSYQWFAQISKFRLLLLPHLHSLLKHQEHICLCTRVFIDIQYSYINHRPFPTEYWVLLVCHFSWCTTQHNVVHSSITLYRCYILPVLWCLVWRQLSVAKEGFTEASLGLLANQRRRQLLTGLLKSLRTIKTLVKFTHIVYTQHILF